MNTPSLVVAVALSLFVFSCAAPHPTEAFQAGNNNVLVIDSLDAHSGQVLSPVAQAKADNSQVLAEIKSMEHKAMAVIILEDYREPEPGKEFRNRCMDWFMGLRQLGYQRIVFLQGQGVSQPDGLKVLAQYY
jgi:hypothetical protein